MFQQTVTMKFLHLVVFLAVLLQAQGHDLRDENLRKALLEKKDVINLPVEGEVRLVGGSTQYEGRVEIFHGTSWGTVCDDLWNLNHAQTVCRQLGYIGAVAKDSAYFGEGTGRIWLDDVTCTGSEARLVDCGSRMWGNTNCNHNEDAGVICRTLWGRESTIRLADGPLPTEGRVEVYYNGGWGTVCDDAWDALDAQVVCREMGYTGGTAYSFATFGEGFGDIHLDGAECDGTEDHIKMCRTMEPWGTNNCNHAEDAGVSCNSDVSHLVRLVNGSHEGEGRVEYFKNNFWGSVCDEQWDDLDAAVVCRQLGYDDGVAYGGAYFGRGEGIVWLHSVRCDGTERDLGMCPHNPWGQQNWSCHHGKDAGASCI